VTNAVQQTQGDEVVGGLEPVGPIDDESHAPIKSLMVCTREPIVGVVPLAVKVVGFERNGDELGIADLDTLRIPVGITVSLNSESSGGGGCRDGVR
jgi:hypothetical protein